MWRIAVMALTIVAGGVLGGCADRDKTTWACAVDGGCKVSLAYVLDVSQGEVVLASVWLMDSQGFESFTKSDGRKELKDLPPEHARGTPIRNLQIVGTTITGEFDLENAQEPTGKSHFKLKIVLSKKFAGSEPVPGVVKWNDDPEAQVLFTRR